MHAIRAAQGRGGSAEQINADHEAMEPVNGLLEAGNVAGERRHQTAETLNQIAHRQDPERPHGGW